MAASNSAGPSSELLGIADVGAISSTQQVGQIRLALFQRQHPQVALPDAQQIESPNPYKSSRRAR